MKLTPNHCFSILTVILLLFVGVIRIVDDITLSLEILNYLFPAIAAIIIFVAFSLRLKWQVGDNLFGELGFLYIAIALSQTIYPAFAFIIGSLGPENPIMWLLPKPSDLAIHLWRQVLFVFGLATGYLLTRGRETTQPITIQDPRGRDRFTIVFLIGIVSTCIVFIILMSAPVDSYHEHYTRFDHLSWFTRRFISVCIRMKLGMYTVLLTFLFLNYKKYKYLTFIAVTAICLHEMIYSFGSRIETLIVLLVTICLYNFTVKSITLKKGLMACVALVIFFSMVEIVRMVDLSFDSAQNAISEKGFKTSAEFISVFLPSFHLYSERAQGTLPPTEWPMFFNDFIIMIPFSDFDQWNPMVWYNRNYFPDVEVMPFNVGPIAESAIWGGEIDLFLRSLINGVFFAYLVRWFLRHKDKWWGIVIYVYCYATCILAIKWSIFWHFSALFKTVLPTIILISVIRALILPKKFVKDGQGNILQNAVTGR